MNKKTVALLLLIVFVFSTLAVGCGSKPAAPQPAGSAPAAQPAAGQGKALILATDKLGATGYIIGEAIATTVNRKSTAIKVSTMTSSGGAENLNLMGTGQATIGNGTSRDWVAAAAGAAPFQKKMNLYQMFGQAWYTMPLMVLDKSPIKSYADLVGKRVFAGGSGSGSFMIYKDLFETLGLFDKVKWVEATWDQAYEGLRGGTIDAAALLTLNNKPSTAAVQMEKMAAYRVLELPDVENTMKKVQEKSTGYLPIALKKDNFKYLTKDVVFPTTSAVQGCDPSLSEEVVYEFVKTVFENMNDIKTLAPDIGDLNPKTAVDLLVPGIPVHPGAAKYFKEKGVWNDKLIIGTVVKK